MGSTTLIRDAFPSNPTLRRKEKKKPGQHRFFSGFPKKVQKEWQLFALSKTVKENKEKDEERKEGE